MEARGGRIAGATAHLVLGTLLAAPLFVLGTELWLGWGILDPDRIDYEKWWWWIPFSSMAFSAALLTVRPRDQRRFWVCVAVPWVAYATVVVVAAAR